MKTVATNHAPAALGPYAQAQISGGFVFTSGQIGIDPATGVIADGIDAQAHQVFRNLSAVLQAWPTWWPTRRSRPRRRWPEIGRASCRERVLRLV